MDFSRVYPSPFRTALTVAVVAAPVSMCSTMSTSAVGLETGRPAAAACSCTMSPPTNVHWVDGRARASSTHCGHGVPQPPGGTGTSQVSRSSSASATASSSGSDMEQFVDDALPGAAFAGCQ